MTEKEGRRCFGRVGPFLLSRCGRIGKWRLVCKEHRTQWLLIPFVVVPWVLGTVQGVDFLAARLKGPSRAEVVLANRAYFELGRPCGSWVEYYASLFQPAWQEMYQPSSRDGDVWDRLINGVKPNYSEATWQHFRPLFDEKVVQTIERLRTTELAYQDVLTPEIRALIWEVLTQLEVERWAYLRLPTETLPDMNVMFQGRFSGALHVCSDLVREGGRAGGDWLPRVP